MAKRIRKQAPDENYIHDEKSLELIARIENSVDHLARVVRELNQFARPKRPNADSKRK